MKSQKQKGKEHHVNGGDNRARTGNLLRARQMLSQIELYPRYNARYLRKKGSNRNFTSLLLPLHIMGLSGFEPLTFRLSAECSTN